MCQEIELLLFRAIISAKLQRNQIETTNSIRKLLDQTKESTHILTTYKQQSMSTSFSGNIQEEIDSKKRKILDITGKPKAQITSHFKTIPKTPKSPSVLKKSTYTTNAAQEELEDHNDPVCTGTMIIYLYLMVDVPLDRDYIGRYRIVLSRLFSSMKSANLNAATILYESLLE